MKRILIALALVFGVLFTAAPAQAETPYPQPYTYGSSGWPNFDQGPAVYGTRQVTRYRVHYGHLQYRHCTLHTVTYAGTTAVTSKTCTPWHYTWYTFIR